MGIKESLHSLIPSGLEPASLTDRGAELLFASRKEGRSMGLATILRRQRALAVDMLQLEDSEHPPTNVQLLHQVLAKTCYYSLLSPEKALVSALIPMR